MIFACASRAEYHKHMEGTLTGWIKHFLYLHHDTVVDCCLLIVVVYYDLILQVRHYKSTYNTETSSNIAQESVPQVSHIHLDCIDPQKESVSV